MKVVVSVVVDVDNQAYRHEYDGYEDPAEIREDIKYRVLDSAQSELDRFPFIKDMWLKP